MGRFIGRRPDETARLARRVAGHLEPGEEVIAAVLLQRPGTLSAEVKGATSGAVTGAIGGTAYAPGREDAEDRADRAGWVAQCEALGVDRALAERTIHSALVLTTARVLVVRRSSLTRRLGEPIGAWPVTEAHVDVPRGEQTLTLRVGDAPLRFELPQAHRFLPDVYRELPALVARARAQATGS